MPHAKCNLQADFVLEHVLIMWCIMFCKMFFMTSNVAESGSQAPNHEKFLRPAFITDWYFLGPCLEKKPSQTQRGTASSQTVARLVVFNYGPPFKIEIVTV